MRVGSKKISEVLIPFRGKALLEHNIDKLKSIGVNEVVIATGVYADDVFAIYGNGDKLGVKIDYIKINGTAGALKKMKDILKSTFIVFNGDIFIKNIDL